MSGMHIRLTNISFSFDKNSASLLEGVFADFKPGIMHFVVGKNGVGKSTLFRIIQGNIHDGEQVSGIIEIDGKKHLIKTSNDMPKIYGISMVQQYFDGMLADAFSFEENLQMASLAHLPRLRPFVSQAPLPDFVSLLNIPKDMPVRLLSGGQRQILAILMAVQKGASLLLLDEPTATLDEENAKLVMSFLTQLLNRRSLTIIIISHDKELVASYVKDSFFEISRKKINTVVHQARLKDEAQYLRYA